jgi:small subunit ribosomal protein S17e
MGRIKTQLVKRKTRDLMEQHAGAFTSDFEKNKELVQDYTEGSSRKLRNLIAGYITRIVKSKKAQ